MKPLFKRKKTSSLQFSVLVIISLTLMVVDHKTVHLKKCREILATAVNPLQYAVDWPFQVKYWLQANVTSYQALLKENTHLKAQQLLLKAQVQKFIALEKENVQLRALLQSSPPETEKLLVAKLLAVVMDPDSRRLVISEGKNAGVYIGQTVLDASGVFGQIVEIAPKTSQVLLLTDPRSAIPVFNDRTGERMIAIGTGVADVLELRHVPKTSSIAVGDVLLTSGLGEHFPAGYPVGTVMDIKQNPSETFATIKIKPSAQFNRSRLVLLVWSKNETLS